MDLIILRELLTKKEGGEKKGKKAYYNQEANGLM